MTPFHFFGGAFLGWSIGGMDFAALFGTAVSSKMVKYWHGVALACVFCFAGCMLQGQKGITTIGSLADMSLSTALVSSVAAATAITILNLLKLPIPTSQAVVGSIAGIALATSSFRAESFAAVAGCWVAAPIASLVAAIPLYYLAGFILGRTRLDIFQRDAFFRIALILAGSYAAYAMGANVVANVGGVFVRAGAMTPTQACAFGGAFIMLGMITFSARVVETVGHGIIKMDALSALISVLAEALTAHFFAHVGVPVSMTQTLIGAIVGIGLVRGANAIRAGMLRNILAGWLVVPVFSCLLSFSFLHAAKALFPGWA